MVLALVWAVFLRNVLVVIIGIVITFIASDALGARKRQKELRETMQLVRDELRSDYDKLETLRGIHHEQNARR